MKIRPLIRLLAFAVLLSLIATAPSGAGDAGEAVKRFAKRGFRMVRNGEGKIVELDAFGATDEDLVGLGRITSLQRLFLANSQVTDAGLSEIATLDSLRMLHLMNSKVTAASFKHMVGLKGLKEVYFDMDRLNDEALRTLHEAGMIHILNTAKGRDGGRAATDADVVEFAVWQSRVTDAGLKELTGLTSLQVLHLNGPLISDAGLKELAVLTKLRTLGMRGSNVTDAGLKAIAGLKDMEDLYVDGPGITDEGMKTIAGFKSLRLLNMDVSSVSDEGVRQLKGLRLHTLGLGQTITDARLRVLREINLMHALTVATMLSGERPGTPERVWSLNLRRTAVTGAGIKELACLTRLQILDLRETRVVTADLPQLKAVPTLGVLLVDDGVINDEALRLLREHDLLHVLASEAAPGRFSRTLRALDLSSKPITDVGLKELTGLRELGVLKLARTGVTDDGVKELAKLPALHTLDLSQTPVSDAGLKELAGFPTLASISLWGTRITDAGLKAFAGHKGLHTLNLDAKQVSDATLRTLRELDMLHVLGLARGNVPGGRPRSAEEVTLVVLVNSPVTDAGLKELAGLKSLELINLRGTAVTAQGIAELTKTLPKLHVLK